MSSRTGSGSNPAYASSPILAGFHAAALAGQTHEVLTAYCLQEVCSPGATPPPRQHISVVSSKVKIRALSDDQIWRYIQTGEPMDKAGAYAAQGVGMCLIERIDGSYTNVVGLPMCQLIDDLDKIFGIPLLGIGIGNGTAPPKQTQTARKKTEV